MAEQMKSSRIDWIGDVPKSWDVEPIKYRVSFYNGDRSENYPSKNEIQSEGIPFINAGHIEGNCLNMNDMDYISEEKYRVMGGVKLQQGDILYCLRGSVGKNIIVNIDKGTVASSLVAIRSNGILNKYLYYCLNSNVEEVQRCLWDNGTAQPNLSADSLGKFKICIPPDNEQQAIADFLDKECAQIDSIAADLEKQIALLQQYKKSLITETVTKGLDKSVPMKDSGVEWIGKIPAHWKAKRLKYVMNNFDAQRKAIEAQNRSQDGEILYDYYGASGAIDKIDDYIFDETSILIGEDGANLVLRNLPLIYIATGKYWVNNHAHILRPKSESDLYYMAHQMEIIDYSQFITGSAQPKLSQENLNNVFLVVPPLNEQQCIASYLEEKISCIDTIVCKKQEQLSTIQQHKKSLIYEYVTGKKRVKEVQ